MQSVEPEGSSLESLLYAVQVFKYNFETRYLFFLSFNRARIKSDLLLAMVHWRKLSIQEFFAETQFFKCLFHAFICKTNEVFYCPANLPQQVFNLIEYP